MRNGSIAGETSKLQRSCKRVGMYYRIQDSRWVSSLTGRAAATASFLISRILDWKFWAVIEIMTDSSTLGYDPPQQTYLPSRYINLESHIKLSGELFALN